MTDDQKPNEVNVTIDGIAVKVPKGTTVYKIAKELGIDIPIFCYHDRMPPFGACRMCLVEVENAPKLQTSCTLEATEGMVVRTQSHIANKGREEILELLLINHPLDCPICDKGGECPLQDQAYKFGPGKSRFYEVKRQFKKPIPLGPVLMLDRERCIICARCTRFCDLVSSDNALEFLDRGYRTEVGTPDGGPAKSKFIGNTIMICPVGALTSRVYRFKARPWDNNSTDSCCTLCPIGCSMRLDERDNEIVRTMSCENKKINDIWLCDKGWFGYEFNSHPDRLKKPLIKENGQFREADWEEALDLIAHKIKLAKADGKIAAFGGNPLTVEENNLFKQLMRHGAKTEHIDHRIGSPIFEKDVEGFFPGMEIGIGDTENLHFALLLGIDITEEFPVIWLRLKQAINKGAQVTFIGHYAPEIDSELAHTFVHRPGNEIETLRELLPKLTANKESGALFVGSQYLASPHRKDILAEIASFRKKYPHFSINLLEGSGNSMGARIAGMRPGTSGLDAIKVLEKSGQEGWDLLYVVGANPAVKYPKKLWNQAREHLQFLIVQDLFMTETAQQADIVLPTLSFLEKEGSFISIDGTIQKMSPGKITPEATFSDGTIFRLIAEKLGVTLSIDSEILELLHLERIPIQHSNEIEYNPTYMRKGDLVATFAPVLFDNGVRMKHNSHLIQLEQRPVARIHPNEAKLRGIADGQRVAIIANGYELLVKISFDDGVAAETIVLPLGLDKVSVHQFGANLMNGLPIELRV